MEASRPLRIVAVGDLMLGDSSHFLGRGVGTHVRRHGADYPLLHIREHLDEADLFVGNLESPLSDSLGVNSWGRVYRGAGVSARSLRLGRRTFLSLANNHILEHGPALLAETRDLLSAAGIDHAGLATDGGLAQAETTLWLGDRSAQALAVSLVRDITHRRVDSGEIEKWLVDRLRAGSADFRMVSLHWGDEYMHAPSPEQRRLAKKLADAGAHLVVGHHPHVLQPVERMGDTVVAYSLGNFLFDHDWSTGTRTGGILEASFASGRINHWRFVATRCGAACQPRIAEAGTAKWAEGIVGGSCALDADAYRRQLVTVRRRMRLRMKAELLRNLPRVGFDTWHFLLTKRRRPRPLLEEGPGAGS